MNADITALAKIVDPVERVQACATALTDLRAKATRARDLRDVLIYRAYDERPASGRFEVCLVPECTEPHKARGLCSVHYWHIFTKGRPWNQFGLAEKPKLVAPESWKRPLAKYAKGVPVQRILERRIYPADEAGNFRPGYWRWHAESGDGGRWREFTGNVLLPDPPDYDSAEERWCGVGNLHEEGKRLDERMKLINDGVRNPAMVELMPFYGDTDLGELSDLDRSYVYRMRLRLLPGSSPSSSFAPYGAA